MRRRHGLARASVRAKKFFQVLVGLDDARRQRRISWPMRSAWRGRCCSDSRSENNVAVSSSNQPHSGQRFPMSASSTASFSAACARRGSRSHSIVRMSWRCVYPQPHGARIHVKRIARDGADHRAENDLVDRVERGTSKACPKPVGVKKPSATRRDAAALRHRLPTGLETGPAPSFRRAGATGAADPPASTRQKSSASPGRISMGRRRCGAGPAPPTALSISPRIPTPTPTSTSCARRRCC